jgi:hypothetical protein
MKLSNNIWNKLEIEYTVFECKSYLETSRLESIQNLNCARSTGACTGTGLQLL